MLKASQLGSKYYHSTSSDGIERRFSPVGYSKHALSADGEKGSTIRCRDGRPRGSREVASDQFTV